MSKNSLLYFILFNLIQFLLIEINCQMTSFKPLIRYLHTATFIDNKLYILGGRYAITPGNTNTIETFGKEFFYLDFSDTLNTQELLWQDLSDTNVVPSHRGAAAVKGGVNNSTLFLYGGVNSTNNGMALVYTFDPRSNSWSIPKKISGDNTIRKSYLTGIIDSNGKMYLFGGRLNNTYLNDMLILDTINLSWGKGSLISAPTPREFYGATLLSNNNIIYIGGNDGVNYLALNEVYIYDTINDNWNVKKTTGKIPSNRARFSAVLGLDGQRTIIFGGYVGVGKFASTSGNELQAEDALYVLDLTNYSWYIPNVSGKIPNNRIWHKANVIGKYMVISFGFGYDQSIESDILLLDISNNEQYIWTTRFQPSASNNKTSSPLPPPSSSSSSLPSTDKSTNNTPVMIGAIIGALFGGILLSFGGFFLYKWNKNKQKQKNAIPTPGSIK